MFNPIVIISFGRPRFLFSRSEQCHCRNTAILRHRSSSPILIPPTLPRCLPHYLEDPLQRLLIGCVDIFLVSLVRLPWCRGGDLVWQYEVFLSRVLSVEWHSGAQPVAMASWPIGLFASFMDFVPGTTFAGLWVVSMEHLQRVWHASGESLPFRTPGPVLFLDLLKNTQIVETSFPEHAVFSRLFMNVPR